MSSNSHQLVQIRQDEKSFMNSMHKMCRNLRIKRFWAQKPEMSLTAISFFEHAS